MATGFVEGGPKLLLRIEGAAILILALVAYSRTGKSWWLFALLFLTPDLGMLAYLANARIGAACYNFVHTLTLPIALFCAGLLLHLSLALVLATIWFAHIGFDRMLGYGLKYASGFGDTHLGRIGRAAKI
ncbi:MAG TPA: DUF4260 domain-containing protein [Methylovirgula sp.]|jgi:hypothetical protein|nr:DUF4260 domain-containing protein [Methylovirgula sp.]